MISECAATWEEARHRFHALRFLIYLLERLCDMEEQCNHLKDLLYHFPHPNMREAAVDMVKELSLKALKDPRGIKEKVCIAMAVVEYSDEIAVSLPPPSPILDLLGWKGPWMLDRATPKTLGL